MRLFLLFITVVLYLGSHAQNQFPIFIEGTWKMEGNEIYEHWDMIGPKTLKGFAYEVKNRQMNVTEYAQIEYVNNELVYTASVIGQNQGQSIPFICTQLDSMWVFENNQHDFPKKIIYQQQSDTVITVEITDGKHKTIRYQMYKQKSNSEVEQDSTIKNPNYNSALAQKFDADEYGMKHYYLVILKTGSLVSNDKEWVSKIFALHLENIVRLVENKQLIVAGPIEKNEKNYRGIFIFDQVKNTEELEHLLKTDPAIAQNLLDYEIYNWYGSAALPDYLEASELIWKIKP